MITWAVASASEVGPLSRWVAELIWPGRNRDFGHCQALAVIENEVLIAGMVYHNFEPEAGVVEISGAGTSKRWLNRETLRTMFQIPFRDWKCQAVVMRVDPDDASLRRMLLAYGFELFTLPRLRGREKDENVFILTDDAWAANKFNRKKG